MSADDLALDTLDEARRVAELVLRVTGAKDGGGCRAFYTAGEWQSREEKYGLGSVLIVVHDGGDLAPWFNPSYGHPLLRDNLQQALRQHGYYAEACTCWYSAIYRA
jgi:hypothetical protein